VWVAWLRVAVLGDAGKLAALQAHNLHDIEAPLQINKSRQTPIVLTDGIDEQLTLGPPIPQGKCCLKC
jgi:hypothetical protein